MDKSAKANFSQQMFLLYFKIFRFLGLFQLYAFFGNFLHKKKRVEGRVFRLSSLNLGLREIEINVPLLKMALNTYS